MTFKELKVGDRFRFPPLAYSGMKTGIMVKISARKYRYESDGMECRVGSIKVVVVRVDTEGNMVRVGHYTPYLGD
jgi:hypothetical protein